MKTAEEWEMNCGSSQMITPQIIRAIQLDAMKEGMRRAAEIALNETFAAGVKTEWEEAYDKGCTDAKEAILTAAEQLTEKDLCVLKN